MLIPFSWASKSPNYLHYTTKSRIMHGLFFVHPIQVTEVVHTVSHHTFLPGFPGYQKFAFRIVFFGDQKKPRDFRSRIFHPSTEKEALGWWCLRLADAPEKRMHWEEIFLTYKCLYIHMFGWYIKYTYSLYVHVWLIYFYRIHWTIVYLPARDG